MDEQNKPKEVVTGQSDTVVDSQPAINGNVIPAADAQQTTPLATEQPAPASGVVAQPATNLPAGVSDYSAQIQQMYDAQLAAKQQALETAYNQNLSTMQAARDKIAPTFINQGNDLATQYERTRRANNMQADMNGLNTGAASQMALAQQSNYLDAFGKVRAAQATAEADANREIADLEVSYKSAVAQALADNDYQKATALLAEYQRRDNAAEEMRRYNQQMDLSQAQLRAEYGDFSGFAALYGTETADAMRQYWAYSNPDYAYSMGIISKKEYERITGKTVSGSVSGSRSRSYGGSGRYTASVNGGGGDDNSNGPGVISPETPTATNTVPTGPDVDSEIAALARRAQFDNDTQYYYDIVQEERSNAMSQAKADAKAAGLATGSAEYNKFITMDSERILANSPTYQQANEAYQNEYNRQNAAAGQQREEARTKAAAEAAVAAQKEKEQKAAANIANIRALGAGEYTGDSSWWDAFVNWAPASGNKMTIAESTAKKKADEQAAANKKAQDEANKRNTAARNQTADRNKSSGKPATTAKKTDTQVKQEAKKKNEKKGGAKLNI